jgi:hypothetical protein
MLSSHSECIVSERINAVQAAHTKEGVMGEVMFTEEEKEILSRIDRYMRGGGKPVSPFIAQYQGKLGQVASDIDVPVEKLDELLNKLNNEVLPPVYCD